MTRRLCFLVVAAVVYVSGASVTAQQGGRGNQPPPATDRLDHRSPLQSARGGTPVERPSGRQAVPISPACGLAAPAAICRERRCPVRS